MRREKGHLNMVAVRNAATTLAQFVDSNDSFKDVHPEDMMAAFAALMLSAQAKAGLQHSDMHAMIDYIATRVHVVSFGRDELPTVEAIQKAIDENDLTEAINQIKTLLAKRSVEAQPLDFEKALEKANSRINEILAKAATDGSEGPVH